MLENELIPIEEEVTEITAKPQSGALLESNTDNILYLAEKADKYIAAMNKIMTAALKITTELDWCLIGGTPYLQESGALKVARLFGISIQLIGKPLVEVDPQGYKTYTYKARFIMQSSFIECEGSRSASEDFFAKAGKDKPLKKPEEIDERDVKAAAYTNCLNNGVKRLIPGLRNIDIKTLEEAGLDTQKIRGYTFNSGSKGGKTGKATDSGLVCEGCGEAISQKIASYSQAKYGAMLCYDCQKEWSGKSAAKKKTVEPAPDDEDLPFA